MSITLDSSVNDVQFVCFDLETTGLDQNKEHIIEIGAVKCTTSEIIETFQTLVQINTNIPVESTRINQITDTMLMGAPQITEVLSRFLQFIGDAVLVAHNIYFDFGFVNAALLNNNFELMVNKFLVDTVKTARKAEPGLNSYALGSLSQHFNISVEQQHRALDDAKACRKIMIHCIDKMSILGELSLSEILV